MKKLLLFLVILCCVSTFALDLKDVQNAIDNAGANWTAKEKYNIYNFGLNQPQRSRGQRDSEEERISRDAYNYVKYVKNNYTYNISDTHTYYRNQNEDSWDQGNNKNCYAWATAGFYELYFGEEAIDETLLEILTQKGKDVNTTGGSVLRCFQGITSFNKSTIYDKEYNKEYKAIKDFNPFPSSYHNNIKNRIDKGIPVVLQMRVYEDFLYYYWGTYKHVTGNPVGYHSVVIVGYNDDFNAFLVKNSWSTGWGDNGYCWIHYDQLNEQSNHKLNTYYDSYGDSFTMPAYATTYATNE